jgi:hypothetical protein
MNESTTPTREEADHLVKHMVFYAAGYNLHNAVAFPSFTMQLNARPRSMENVPQLFKQV